MLERRWCWFLDTSQLGNMKNIAAYLYAVRSVPCIHHQPLSYHLAPCRPLPGYKMREAESSTADSHQWQETLHYTSAALSARLLFPPTYSATLCLATSCTNVSTTERGTGKVGVTIIRAFHAHLGNGIHASAQCQSPTSPASPRLPTIGVEQATQPDCGQPCQPWLICRDR